ncbi:MAG: T9SS type A sorting domain-containing protein [Ignavibacteria bacterium]
MKNLVLLLLIVLVPYIAYAQKDTREVNSQIVFNTPLNGPQHTTPSYFDKAKVDEITAQIREARLNGDAQKSNQLQSELERITGSKSIHKPAINNTGFINTVCNEPVEPGDYNLTIISGSDASWACATSTDRVTGRIYVVAAKYSSSASASDSMKVFTSSNDGITWVMIARVANSSAVKWRNDELDAEAMNDGDTSFVFVVAGYSLSGVQGSVFFRWNRYGGAYVANDLFSPSAGNEFIYPRITSDNGRYTSISYVYILCTQDTTTSTRKNLRDKFAIVTNPYASVPTITYRNHGDGGCYAWFYNNVHDTTLQYNDIAYSDSASTDRIVTVTNYYKSAGYYNLYLSYSSDYGNSAPAYLPQITETYVNYKPRLASTQLDISGAQYMMIAYTRKWSDTDWDPYFRRTTNNGANWIAGYVSAVTDSTLYTDVVSIPRVPNTFRVAYMVRTGITGSLWTRSYNAGTFITAFNIAAGMSSTYTPIRAGYRYNPADSCFSVCMGLTGLGLYAYSGCSGTLTGIGNTETPLNYSLSQNYPNPFNPATKINYSLPVAGFVSLNIYDLTGRLVSKLVNENKAAGNYIVDFSGVNLSSGTYFCRMESGSYRNVIKLMLIK